MKKTLTIILTICILVSLAFFLQATDLKVVVNLVGTIGNKFFLLLLITFIAYLFGTISWQYALGTYSNAVSTSRLFLIRHLGETVGMFNPASVIAGDAIKAVMLRKYDIPANKIASSLLLSRAIMVVTQIVLCGATALMLVIQNPSFNLDIFHTIKKSGLYLSLLTKWKIFRGKLSGVLNELPSIVRENKRMLRYACLFAALHWVVGGLEFYFILKFLGLKVSVLQALIVDLGVVLFKAAGAVIPGQLGVEEYGNKIMLMAIGLPSEEVWVTASILRRGRQLFWIAFGIGVYLILFRRQNPDAAT